MTHYECPEGHQVRAPGQMGRSWCPVCQEYGAAIEVGHDAEGQVKTA